MRRSLSVGAANDPAERQADHVARQVLTLLRDDRIRRKESGAEQPGTAIAGVVGAAGGPVDREFEQGLASARGGGAPLPSPLGERMQRAFGADFSDVRVHEGRAAQELNSRIQARAFTTGNDIFLGQSAPPITSPAGTELLAHELTHVVQQSGGVQRAVIRRDFIHGSAAEDAVLFDKEPPVSAPALKTGSGTRADKFGITSGNLEHYLERHTFKYQRLNAKTVSPGAGMFPYKTDGHLTTAADVAAMLDEALDKLPDGTAIGTTPVSVAVDLKNGLRVNVGALKGGKLSAFFPIAGGTNAGFHEYTSDELNAIRAAKNAPGGAP